MRLILLLLLSTGCVSSTKTSQVQRSMKSTTDNRTVSEAAGGNSFNFVKNSRVLNFGGPDVYILPIVYPTNIVTTDYRWFVDVSTNLVEWSTYLRVLSSNDVFVPMVRDKNQFFRMRGVP